MRTQRLDSLINEAELIGECFLNADIQGAELLALKGMGDLIKSFKWAYLEVNKKETYVGCADINDIDEYLFEYGFERIETGNWVADTWTDALYQKVELRGSILNNLDEYVSEKMACK